MYDKIWGYDDKSFQISEYKGINKKEILNEDLVSYYLINILLIKNNTTFIKTFFQ